MSKTFNLKLFGPPQLTDPDGRDIRTELGGPKRFAILSYVAAAHAGRPVRRDTLLVVFWPELDQERGRRALRQALHGIRQAVGDQVLRTLTVISPFSRVVASEVLIRINAIGFRQIEWNVDPRGRDSLSLSIPVTQLELRLEDIVITATGPSRRRELGHEVTTIDAATIVREQAVFSLSDLLAARTPSVAVMPAGGIVGEGARIRIRGSTSMLRPNQPIVVLDGIRLDSDSPGSTITPSFTRLDDLNPEDIASIEVIRGPSAVTMYGTDAANGIIRITTKQGRPGPARWEASVERGLSTTTQSFLPNFQGVDASGSPCSLIDVAAGVCEQDHILEFSPLVDAPV